MKTITRTVRMTAVLIFTILFMSSPKVLAAEQKSLIAAGTVFGVKIHIDGVIIAGIPGTDGPAAASGLKRGDLITKINGKPITSAEQFTECIQNSNGNAIELIYQSGGRDHTATITPIQDENGEYKLGIWIKDSAAGIGTVTFIDPETMCFAGLGHGICDSESGCLLPFSRGTAEEVLLSGVTIGESGTPGELRGSFAGNQIGKLTENAQTGIYGVLSDIPIGLQKERFPIAEKEDVKEGKAYIFSTVDGEGRKLYEIEISSIEIKNESRNFLVHVTDPELLEKTGGIVQGMSGSPIIQNGKLIGAVTHVLVNDPTMGYGILIENMLDAAA